MISLPIKWIFKGIPPRWLFESSGVVRNDLAIQRVARMRALYVTACAKWPGSEPANGLDHTHLQKLFSEYDLQVQSELNLRSAVMGDTPIQGGLLLALRSRSRKAQEFHAICRDLHHRAHDIQMALVTLLPIRDLEASLPGLRTDFESVTDEDSRGLLLSPIGAYVTTVAVSNLGSPVGGSIALEPTPVVPDPAAPDPAAPDPAVPKPPAIQSSHGAITALPTNYEPYLRSFCRQLVHETRRNQLTKRQIEVVRDELFSLVTFSFFFMSFLSVAAFLGFYSTRLHNRWWHEPTYAAAFVAAVGGIAGASLSAYQRIGTISRSGVTGRNLGELSGAGKPLFQAVGFGCLAAILLQLLIAHAGLRNLGPFTLPEATAEAPASNSQPTPAALPADTKPSINQPQADDSSVNAADKALNFINSPPPTVAARQDAPVSLALLPLLVGLLAGFSERLVPDVIDQYRKK